MLPSVPKTLGTLSYVLESARSALLGQQNQINLPPRAKSGIVILIDGLGWHNLRGAGAHARFLNSHASDSKPVNTVFPSTTAAALTSLATGAPPNRHGIAGYRVFDRSSSKDVNLLSGWTSFEQSDGWRLLPTIAEEIGSDSGLEMHFVGASAYQRSGFTNIIMPTARYHGEDSIAARFATANRLANTPGNLVYLYIPELDQTAHALGAGSIQWLAKLEDLDGLIRKLVESAGSRTGIAITADHGVVDVPSHAHLDLADLQLPEVLHFGGDTRCGFLYLLDPNDSEDAEAAITAAWGSAVTVVTPKAAIEAGWMSAAHPRVLEYLPDLLVVSNKLVAVYHRKFSSLKSRSMVGHHGSWTSEEMQIPLLKLGLWA